MDFLNYCNTSKISMAKRPFTDDTEIDTSNIGGLP